MFIRTVTIKTPQQEQGMSLIRKWTDAHHLKEFNGKWYKDGCFVITGDLNQKRMILRNLHDARWLDIRELPEPEKSSHAITGGPDG